MMENERSLYKDLESILYTKEQLAQAVHELGVRITRDYEGRRPVLENRTVVPQTKRPAAMQPIPARG